jgi:hypothetical protein
MNHLHLQETARHYANLAEQYRTELAEEQQLNEDLLGLVEALCEELDIDVEALLEMSMRDSDYNKRRRYEDRLADQGQMEKSWKAQHRTERLLRSDQVHDARGNVVHPGVPNLGWRLTGDPSDKDIEAVQSVVGEVGHIVGAPDDESYATSEDDIVRTKKHPVFKRVLKPANPTKPSSSASNKK